jgi:uncharacterized membrane protein
MGGGGFIIGFITSFRVQERGGFRVAVAAASQEAQDEKLKTRSSRREAQDVAAAIRAYRVTWSWEISRKQT